MKIDAEFIEQWEPKYDEIESDELEYQLLINCVTDDIANLQSIRLKTFERIINWKSRRTKGYIKWEDYALYHRAFQSLLDIENSKKLNYLVTLPGFGAPVASTYLHFIFPHIFPIYDKRTVAVLYDCNYIRKKTTCKGGYLQFQQAIHDIRLKLVQYNLRQIDRAIFAYHKLNYKKVTSTYGKKRPSLRFKSNQSVESSLGRPSTPTKRISIPEVVKSICEELGKGGAIIYRQEILKRVKAYKINESSVLPADYCENTKTGKWSRYSFLHAIEGQRGQYKLARFK